ncbi:hypothetical protein V6N11_083041 [Hibiscus sabdariffa]|uniref:U-box domain-containing protein n=1 Tax=Hibiscus sabdariffa TaxID=183260 RepID=A0ABR2QKQ1_9ROSI
MQRGSYESRAYAIFLLQSMLEIDDPMQLIGLRLELFIQLVQVLCDKISQHASKAKLKLMRRTCEIILTVLDEVCRCWEGPSELLNHGAGLTVVLKKILRVSRVANQRTVRIMWSISKFCATCNVLQEMVQLVLGHLGIISGKDEFLSHKDYNHSSLRPLHVDFNFCFV